MTNESSTKGTFSKDNVVVEISSKQNQTHTTNIVIPERPKETKK